MIYLASPFFTPKQLSTVVRLEAMLTERNIDFFSPRLHGVDMSKLSEYERKYGIAASRVFGGNISSMDEADAMIACIDDRDQGTNFEIGYYYANNVGSAGLRCRSLVTFSGYDYASNLMISQCANAHFKCHDDIAPFLDAIEKSNRNLRMAFEENSGLFLERLDVAEN